MIGKNILHYKIIEKLGEGGMGIVYKAQDTKLNRDVAIKLLPPHLLVSEDDRSRFNREAKAAAALNHNHIATVFEINEIDGKPFIVMEYVEGKTLDFAIAKAPLKLEEAVSITIQIADGLQAAHKKDVVHRDIKSTNILLGPDNQAKILDFGLAKTSMSTKLTQMGTTIGTVAYMSPEQIQGKEVDNRTDLWSLGIVLYEMIAGHLPFKAEYDQAVFYSIQNENPDPLTSLRTGVPLALEWIVNKMMAKDPNERYQTAKDLIIDLKAVDLNASGFSRTSSVTRQNLTGNPAIQNKIKPTAEKSDVYKLLSITFFAIIIAYTFWTVFQPAEEARIIRSYITPPANHSFDAQGYATVQMEISPDGKLLVYATRDSNNLSSLWVRRIDALTAQNLNGTEGAFFPFWSPDSRFIAFFARGKLKKIDVFGGPALTICDASIGRGGTWNKNNIIAFTPEAYGGIHSVPAGGGKSQKINTVDATVETHRWASFLPDGNHFLFFARHYGKQSENDGIYVGSLDGKVHKKIVLTRSNAHFTNGYVVYVLDGTLVAQKFDSDNFEITGSIIPLVENIQYTQTYSRGAFTVSENGMLVYLNGSGKSAQHQLAWYDRKGTFISNVGPEETYRFISLSNDGKKIISSRLEINTRQQDLWIRDLNRNVESRFTFNESDDLLAVWSPDNSIAIFNSARNGDVLNLFQKNTDGSGEVKPMLINALNKYATDWSSDGQFITYTSTDDTSSKWDIWVLPVKVGQAAKEEDAVPYLRTKFNEGRARFSPDGKWLAYISDESGKEQLYLSPFPGTGAKWQISTEGIDNGPYWNKNGREIIYTSEKQKMIQVNINALNNSMEIGKAVELFALPAGAVANGATNDGLRFLIRLQTSDESNLPMTLVSNWHKELENK